jgi:CRISPR/Cas system-associated protein Cas10 (large subunit of type III CRISPR-Cas system)
MHSGKEWTFLFRLCGAGEEDAGEEEGQNGIGEWDRKHRRVFQLAFSPEEKKNGFIPLVLVVQSALRSSCRSLSTLSEDRALSLRRMGWMSEENILLFEVRARG